MMRIIARRSACATALLLAGTGKLTLENVTVANGSAFTGGGGAIFNQGMLVTR
jgi:hypothetical protein